MTFNHGALDGRQSKVRNRQRGFDAKVLHTGPPARLFTYTGGRLNRTAVEHCRTRNRAVIAEATQHRPSPAMASPNSAASNCTRRGDLQRASTGSRWRTAEHASLYPCQKKGPQGPTCRTSPNPRSGRAVWRRDAVLVRQIAVQSAAAVMVGTVGVAVRTRRRVVAWLGQARRGPPFPRCDHSIASNRNAARRGGRCNPDAGMAEQ